MSDLSDIYRSVKNPIKDKEMLKKIIDAYEKSHRANMYGAGIYEKLVKLSGNRDNSVVWH